MSRFFVVGTDPLTEDQEKALASFAASPAGWWHWLPNFWLIRDDTDSFTAESIRTRIAEIAPTARCMVLQVDPVRWSGRVRPDNTGNKMEDWLLNYWPSQ